ncbi:MAG: SDR family oxidoreductase [Candidatus Hydrogenedentes bacterium]|nr:SDR family oxidoreductase [Candidatus Hydrogenedentota bacterium]
MPGLLSNQVAIVTGAGRGIGAATARLFAHQGARVVVSDLDPEPAKAVVAEIAGAGGQALAVAGDVTDAAFPDRIMSATIEAYGKLNILVNNAGYTWDGVVHKMTDDQWQAMLDCHVTGPFRMIRAAAPHMREVAKQELAAGKTPEPRCIVNVSSTSGIHGNAGQVNYATAKMGVLGMTMTIAKEWGQFGIRCNCVAFGMIDTRLSRSKELGESIDVHGSKVPLGIPETLRQMATMLIPLGRWGDAEEAAGGILMLASPYASYVTGHCLEVTGGFGI